MTRRWPIGVLGLLVAALVAGELVIGGSGKSPPAAPPLPSEVLVAPRVDLAALRGQPALINFWASWCPPCRREAPQLRRFAGSLHGQGRLVGVDWNDALAGARAYIRRYSWRFPDLRDGDGTVGNNYGLVGLPTTFVIDPQGRIAEELRGPQTVTSLRNALRSVG